VRLLLVNFAMDSRSPVLAWQARLASELARRCERVVVLTEQVGDHEPHEALVVHGVPHVLSRAPLRWLKLRWGMAAAVARWCRREAIDVCFVHMSAGWAYRLWPALRPLGVPILLWYAHGTVTWRLRLAHRAADCVVTSSPEGFRLPSAKLAVIGQAIDTELFRPTPPGAARNDVLYVGRISPRKRIERVLDSFAAACALAPGEAIRLRLVGPTLNRADRAYGSELRARARALGIADRVDWVGPLTVAETASLYASAFVHVNLSQTGSMDKTVLEALACGCPAVTSNEAFRSTLAGRPGLFVADPTPDAVARAVLAVRADPMRHPPDELRALVVGRHDLGTHVDKLLAAVAALVPRHGGALTVRAVRP
jgi:glycosyltransferase involved in cell wall biosynthesis